MNAIINSGKCLTGLSCALLTSFLVVNQKLAIIVARAVGGALKSSWGVELTRYEFGLLLGELETLVEVHWEESAMMEALNSNSMCISRVLHDC
jgi:hypothetical protein